MTNSASIEARQPKGFQDYLPKVQIPRQALIQVVRQCFELFGFDPLETPAIEQFEILVSDPGEFDARIYRTDSWSGSDTEASMLSETKTALRFDLTVPLARVFAMNRDLPRPFYRYQLGNVWRGERPQAGRYREFAQFDADIVGSESVNADIEIIQLIMFTLRKILNDDSFTVSINTRKILNGLPELLGFSSVEREKRIADVIRILDKAEKISREEMIEALKAPRNENKNSPELSGQQVEKLFLFTDLCGDPEQLLDEVERLLAGIKIAEEGVRDLRNIIATLDESGYGRELWQIDLMLARGLGYYTGAVFEARLDKLPGIGSVFSGGRYDKLIGRFCKEDIPATGASIGIDRLVAALVQQGSLEEVDTQTQVLVLSMDESLRGEYVAIARECRESALSTRVYPDAQKMKVQMKYASKLEIPFVVIYGPEEKKRGIFSIKDMSTRKQHEFKVVGSVPTSVSQSILTLKKN